MTIGDRLARAGAALLIGAILSLAFAQQAEPPSGLVPPGTLQLVCLATACDVELPVVGRTSLGADRVRVVAPYPPGTHRIQFASPEGAIEATFAVCGRTAVVELRPDAVVTTSEPCPATGALHVADLPDGTFVSIDGASATLDVQGRIAVYAGDYQLRVERPGYQAFTATVSVGDGERIDVEPDSARLPGTLVLQIPSDGTRVYVDDELRVADGRPLDASGMVDVTPDAIRLTLPAGEATVRVERDGYEPFATTVRAEADVTATTQVVLAPLPGQVTLRPFPSHANVFIDGRRVPTDSPIALDPGSHDLTATASGFEPWSSEITVTPGETLDVPFELIGDPVTLRVRGVPPNATVVIDGGEPVPAGAVISALPGQRVLRVSAPGYATLERDLLVTTDILQTINVELQRNALLRLDEVLETSRITVGGDTYAPSVGSIELPPGRYDVAVDADGYEPAQTTIDLAAGADRVLDVDLKPVPALITIPNLPAGFRAYVDGVPTRIRDDSIGPLMPGRYDITLESDIHEPVDLTIDVEAGNDLTMRNLAFTFRPARLTLDGAPAGTRVKIGDADVVPYDGSLEVPVGEHVVWIAADGYGRVRVTIDVGPGELVTVPVEFE